MFKAVANWFKRTSSGPAKYKIVHDPELGYLACFNCTTVGWRIIEADGTTSVHPESAVRFKSPWCETEEEAGMRINRHSTNRGQRTIWYGG